MSTTITLNCHGITIPANRISAFCVRWHVREMAVFGSFLTDDFRDDSDIDLLIDAKPGVKWGLNDLLAMTEELAAFLGRPVELVDRESLEASRNYLIRKHVKATAEPIYVEG